VVFVSPPGHYAHGIVHEHGEAVTMTTEMRKTGIEVVGDVPWGTHLCVFYETREDILRTVVSWCKSGLEGGEFCLWVVSEPITVDEATQELRRAVPALDRYLIEGRIEIVAARDWYLPGGTFDLKEVIVGWQEVVARASARGFPGVRVTGDTAWLKRKDWKDFCEYEGMINGSFADQRVALLCTYPLGACGATEVLDVLRTHQVATARRRGTWDVIETAGLKQAKAEIKRLNDELEQRVVERTGQLMAASEALREVHAQLAHVTRVMMLGEVTASFAHELTQPLAAVVNTANVGLRLLSNGRRNVTEARGALGDIVRHAGHMGAIIERVRGLAKRTPSERLPVRMAEVVDDVVALAAKESVARHIRIVTDLAEDLPLVLGDRVQLIQVLLNLVMNGMDAMSSVDVGERKLEIRGRIDEHDGRSGARMSVQDSGMGLPPEQIERVFEAFYTTKPRGLGMGLAISRSIISAHGGRLWPESNPGRGATFCFFLPAAAASEADMSETAARTSSGPNIAKVDRSPGRDRPMIGPR
jgi:signal transduction histidine kinase